MIEHPWTELQLLIKEKWLTQKEFSSILWKKVSELNELLKWKRNITIQRDYLLHQTLWTPMKYWILKQIDYDYSLLDIEEPKSPPLVRGDTPEELGGFPHQTSHSEPEASSASGGRENPSNITPMDFSLQSKWQKKPEDEVQVTPLDKEGLGEIWSQIDSSSSLHSSSEWHTNTQETPIQELNSKNDEDLKNRAKIFRTF